MAHVALPRVDVFEVMLVLILFCQGDAGAKLKTMFGVFDADDSGSMTTVRRACSRGKGGGDSRLGGGGGGCLGRGLAFTHASCVPCPCRGCMYRCVCATQAEMYEFMRILAKASTKIGVLPAAPDEEVLLTLTAKMFMTADGDRRCVGARVDIAVRSDMHD